MAMLEIYTNVGAEYPDCLRDESRSIGTAHSISFPRSEEDIKEALAFAREQELPVTTQGARTGITGGAVSDGGHIINVSRMTRVTGMRHDPAQGDFFIRVQPGVVLGDLIKMLSEKSFDTDGWSDESLAALAAFRKAGPYKLGPDPTEWSASLGGMAACNASGAKSFFYGATRRHVTGLRVVLADGEVLDLRRGRETASGRHFRVETDAGRVIEGDLPSYEPPSVKTAAGYHASDDMDLVDLFIGSEGTLGIFPEIELGLVPVMPVLWGVVAFLPSEEAAVAFVRAVRGDEAEEQPTGLKPAAIEFFDHHALELLRRHLAANPGFIATPGIPDAYDTGIYIEFQGETEDEVSDAVMRMAELMVECGGDEDATWIATEPREWERLREFRHAVPEVVNLLIDERRKTEPALTKLGTDMSVPDDRLEDVMELYHKGLDESGLEYVMFGHISSNHVHVNILPRDMEEYRKGKDLYFGWAREVVAMGGSVSAEHGIGKLKKSFLQLMYGDEGLEEMRRVKLLFDPDAILNRGNLFDV